MKPPAKLPDDADLETLTDIGYLRHAYKTSSKYIPHWLELKYTHQIQLNIPDIRGAHRKYRQAIARLMRQDEYFRALCLQLYGHELDFISTSLNHDILEMRLVMPEQKTETRQQIKFT